MRKLVWQMNVSLDGFADHTVAIADDELHEFATDQMDRMDILLFGRVTYQPIDSLSEEELIRQALEERVERAQTEKMQVKSLDPGELWTDYMVMNRSSGKTYRVALRGWERGESYCSCPDYRKNTLGTCKHVLHVAEKVKQRFNKTKRETPYRINDICIYLQYGKKLELRLLIPEQIDRKTIT